MKKNVLVTGCNGFIGAALLKKLSKNKSYNLTGASRSAVNEGVCSVFHVGEVDGSTDWRHALKGQSIVIHCSGISVANGNENEMDLFKRINSDGTTNLAKQAAASGASRFIFLSSVKVNGETTEIGEHFNEESPVSPQTPYASSKLMAEIELNKISLVSGLEIVIIRSPLVFGRGVRGNFKRLIELVKLGLPLPLSSVDNKRSMIGVDNLVDLISICVDHPAAANQLFFSSEDFDFSTSEVLSRIADALGKKIVLFHFSPYLLTLLSRFLNRGGLADRLFGNLQVDSSKARNMLGWAPAVSIDDSFRQSVLDCQSRKG